MRFSCQPHAHVVTLHLINVLVGLAREAVNPTANCSDAWNTVVWLVINSASGRSLNGEKERTQKRGE